MCVIFVQELARDRKQMAEFSISDVLWDQLKMQVERQNGIMQRYKQQIASIDSDIQEQNSALQGESCPEGNRGRCLYSLYHSYAESQQFIGLVA